MAPHVWIVPVEADVVHDVCVIAVGVLVGGHLVTVRGSVGGQPSKVLVMMREAVGSRIGAFLGAVSPVVGGAVGTGLVPMRFPVGGVTGAMLSAVIEVKGGPLSSLTVLALPKWVLWRVWPTPTRSTAFPARLHLGHLNPTLPDGAHRTQCRRSFLGRSDNPTASTDLSHSSPTSGHGPY